MQPFCIQDTIKMTNKWFQFILDNPDKHWSYTRLSQNLMEKYQFPLCMIKRRAKERMAIIKEELIAKAWHPKRVQVWVDAGMDIDDM